MNIRRILLSVAVSGICLYFVVRGVQWDEVFQHLSQVNIPLFLLSMLLMLVAYFLMTWRWQHLLAPLEMPGVPAKSGILGLYGKVMTGYFFNAFFPARAGD